MIHMAFTTDGFFEVAIESWHMIFYMIKELKQRRYIWRLVVIIQILPKVYLNLQQLF